MPKKAKSESVVVDATTIDALYVEFLHYFYDQGNRRQAAALALRLEAALAGSSALGDSIRGEEIRSLIAELRGDYQAAIGAREAEIRKILELHALAVNTPSWHYVSRQYDFADVSDRLDLLAMLYDRRGDLGRAIATLRESQQYCASHDISFDGQDLLDEIEGSRHEAGKNGVPRSQRTRKSKAAKRG